jgi:ribose transport system substrate-binding protein
MKRISMIVIACLVIVPLLVSCGTPAATQAPAQAVTAPTTAANTESAPATSTETVAPAGTTASAPAFSGVAQYKKDPPYTIGWSINNSGISWRTEYIAEFNEQAKRFGSLIKSTIVIDANSDVNKQIADIEDLLAKKVDALIIDPQSPTALVPVVEKAYQSGIPVIIVNDNIETDQYTAFVSVDHFDFGKVGAEWLVKAMGGKGNVVVLDGIAGMGVAVQRFDGANSVFSQYPDIKIIDHEYAEWSYDKAKIAMQNVLSAYPQIDGIWSSGGDMTTAALDAFTEAGRPYIPMTGEASNGFMKKWLSLQPNGFTSIAPYMPTWLSASALNMAVEALIGFPVPHDTIYPTPTFTEADLTTMVRQDLPDSYWLGSLLPDATIKEIFKGQ